MLRGEEKEDEEGGSLSGGRQMRGQCRFRNAFQPPSDIPMGTGRQGATRANCLQSMV